MGVKLSNIDAATAHMELEPAMLVHYLLGRQLAQEQVLRELVAQMPAARRAELTERLRYESDTALQRVGGQDPADMGVLHVSDCGYACGLIQMGF